MKGKTALVTGGSAGIGKATARAFGEAGASVIIVSRTKQRGQATEAELREAGIDVKWLQTDVANPAEVKAVIEQAQSINGRIDFAFNNAKSDGRSDLVANIDEVEWEKTISGVLSSVFYCMKYELQVMTSQGGGVIINNASVDGLCGFAMDPAYSAAKHGVVGLTKSAALQYAQKGVRINAVCPSWIKTERIAARMSSSPSMEQEILARQPIGRLGWPEEVAAAVVWLCSKQSSFITGAAIPIDGGYTAV